MTAVQDDRSREGADSSDPKARLIAAALEAFGRVGFEAASTRKIAGAAKVNLASIPYYFGGKEGLYLAVARHIADEIGSRMGEPLAAAAKLLENPSTPDAVVRQAVFAMVDRQADLLLGRKEAALWARFILREQMEPSAAFDVIYESFMGRALEVVAMAVGRLLGRDPEDEVTRITVFTALGQVVIFRAGRAAVLRRLDWQDMGPEEIGKVKAVLRRNLAAILDRKE